MNVKKLLPVILLVIMAIVAISIKRCNSSNRNARVNAETKTSGHDKTGTNTSTRRNQKPNTNADNTSSGELDRSTTDLYFTKHAKCRMKCRHITQQEVKDILANGEINYNKSDLQDPKGPTYAVEGVTRDRQRVRIIFAPKKAHLTVVTVIDLEVEYACSCN